MRCDVVRDLVRHAGREGMCGPALDLGKECAFEHEQDMAA